MSPIAQQKPYRLIFRQPAKFLIAIIIWIFPGTFIQCYALYIFMFLSTSN